MDDKTSAKSAKPAAPLDQHEIRRIVIGVLVAMLLGALDQTIIATALPTIGRALSDLETLSWVVTSYLVAATAVTPIYGKLSDTYGRRKTMLAGILIFLAGSVACALAPSMTALIVARFVQGLGGGGLLSLAQTVIGDVVPPRERGRYQGYIGAVFATASVAGPALGGVTAEYLHWSLIFWINLPIGLIAWLMTRNGLRRLPHHHRPHDIDYTGAALMVLATVALLLALTFGGTRFAWASGPILGLFAMSIGLWFLFALRLRAAAEPFLPLSLLANKIVRMGAGSGALAMGTMTGLSIFSPLYFETVYRLSSSRSGLAMIPMLFAITVSSTYAGRLMSRMIHYKRIAVIGLLSASAALAVLALHPANLSFSTVLILFAIVGAGIGPAFPVTTVAIQNAVPMHQLGTATGLLNFARQLSSALIVAVFGAIALGGMGLAPRPLLTIGPNENAPATFQLIFAAAILGLLIALTFLLLMEERRLRGPDDPI